MKRCRSRKRLLHTTGTCSSSASRRNGFAFVNVETFDFCNIKCAPDRIVDLQERYEGVTPAYHMNKKHWISVHFDKDVPDRTIEDLVKQSYDLVAASLPKKERAALQTP